MPPEAQPKGDAERAPETEPLRRVFEYRDADGRWLGTAEVAFDQQEQPMPYKAAKDGAEATGRKLRSFVLRGEKDGKPTEIDMLALAVPAGVEVLASDVPLANYHYENQDRKAFVPPLETPLDVGVFFHELGHAEQHQEERFEKITPLYGESKPLASGSDPVSVRSFLKLLDAVNEAVPDARTVFDDQARDQLARLEEQRQSALDKKSSLERALDEQESLRNSELRALLGEAMAERADLAAIADEAKRVGIRESHPVPPLVASPDVAALVARLEDAGFRFEGSGTLAAATAGAAKPGIGFDAAQPRTERMVRRSAIATAEQASAVVDAIGELRAVDADVQYDPTSETLFASFTVDVPHAGPGRVIVEARVSDDRFAQYEKLRTGADRIVADLERNGDAEYENAVVAGDAERLLLGAVNLNDIAALPTRMMERDATRRALRWLRQVRDKAGVNLLAPHLVQPERLAGGDQGRTQDCTGSTAAGMATDDDGGVETTILEDLRHALEGYGAARMRLRPPDQEDHLGITPSAGRGRPPSGNKDSNT